MPSVAKVGLLGMGEVGRIVAEDILRHAPETTLVCWDTAFSDAQSKASQHCAELAGFGDVQQVENAAQLASGCDLVISAVTAGEAIAAALSVLPGLRAGCWYMDLNSVSPGSKITMASKVAEAGGRFVEVAVMSPIQPQRSASPMLLAGSDLNDFLEIGRSLGFSGLRLLSDQQGQAAATKMCRSVVIKGIEALLTESLLTARHYGVEHDVLASLGNLLPGTDWETKSQYMISRSIEHGRRRAEEMLEACETVADAGLSPWMSRGAVERQDWAAQFDESLGRLPLNELLSNLLTERNHNQ